MSYERTKRLLAGFLVLYALIGFGAHVTHTSSEDVYPFFSWFLFVTVPPRVQAKFDFVLISVNGQNIETPVSPLSRPDVFSPEGVTEQNLSELAEHLRKALQVNDTGDVTYVRGEFEKHFTVSRASYGVRETTYNPIDYFKNGTVASSTVFAEFNVGAQ